MKPLYIFAILLILPFLGCKKYLDEKPNQQLALPTDNLNNLLLILDDTDTMNGHVPSGTEVCSDNFYIDGLSWSSLQQSSQTEAGLYIWDRNLFNDADDNDWTLPYKTIFNANLVLSALDQIAQTPANAAVWNNVKGMALFFRAFSYLALVQEFAKAYNSSTAASDLGVALRLSPNISDKSVRVSNQQCYTQIRDDLQASTGLLLNKQTFKTRPSKSAAFGLLARAYLLMGDYSKALSAAQSYLAISPNLVDFNSLSLNDDYPFARYNDEVSFHATLNYLNALSSGYGKVDDDLFASYADGDLRKAAFFVDGGAGNITFKGSYDGSDVPFGGIATDEVYLIAAECYARLADSPHALGSLNTLLVSRWKKGAFVPLTADNAQHALQTILTERRKELVFRNLRWGDLKRLNLTADFQTTIKRSLNGKDYTLSPNDRLYVLPLPQKVIQLSGMQQNE